MKASFGNLVRLVLPMPALLAMMLPVDIAAARAADGDPYLQCDKKADFANAALVVCDGAEIDRRNLALNTAYQALMAGIPELRKPLLRTAERGWIAYRDAECVFQASAEAGGTDEPLIENSCILEFTATRTAELKSALKAASFFGPGDH